MAKELPRGVRNNNPGNIDRNSTKWQGMAAEQTDSRFITFESPEWGIRALARVLLTYFDTHDLDTVRKIISRWAPPEENNTESYIDMVAGSIGVSDRQALNLHDYAHMKPLVEAIILHECGKPSLYGRGDRWYPKPVIDEGLRRAGILPPPRTVAKRAMTSPEVVGPVTTGTGTAVALVAEQMNDTAVHVQGAAQTVNSNVLNMIVVALIVIGLGLTVYAIVRRNRGNSA